MHCSTSACLSADRCDLPVGRQAQRCLIEVQCRLDNKKLIIYISPLVMLKLLIQRGNSMFSLEKNSRTHLHIACKSDFISLIAIFNNKKSCIGWNRTEIIRNHCK